MRPFHRRVRRLPTIVVAAALAITSVVATAGPASAVASSPTTVALAGSATGRTFTVKQGHYNDLRVALRSIRRGDRLALEGRRRGHWVVYGSVSLSAKQAAKVVALYGGAPGSYFLRFAVLRGRRATLPSKTTFTIKVTGSGVRLSRAAIKQIQTAPAPGFRPAVAAGPHVAASGETYYVPDVGCGGPYLPGAGADLVEPQLTIDMLAAATKDPSLSQQLIVYAMVTAVWNGQAYVDPTISEDTFHEVGAPNNGITIGNGAYGDLDTTSPQAILQTIVDPTRQLYEVWAMYAYQQTDGSLTYSPLVGVPYYTQYNNSTVPARSGQSQTCLLPN